MIQKETINCPYCGNSVVIDAKKCEACGALYADPELPDFRFQDFRIFVALEILTFGLFGIVWFFINTKAINKIAAGLKDKLKLNWLVLLLLVNLGMYVYYLGLNTHGFILSMFIAVQYLIFIALTYRVIRIIQKYTQKTYDVVIEYNPYYIVIFNVLYLIHFIDTYTNRVLHVHEHFNAKSPQVIFLIILLLIIQFIFCLDTNVHQFYRWFFSF